MKISNSEYEPINLKLILPVLNNIGLNYEFLLITPTGYDKSIMDATASFRSFLKHSKLHNYNLQNQGSENKKFIKTYIITNEDSYKTKTSLYRPNTKKGDPRIWVYKLGKFCKGGDTLLFLSYKSVLFVLNISNKQILDDLVGKGKIYNYLKKFSKKPSFDVELLNKIQKIHNMGFIPAIKKGDTAVGATLEYYLGIPANSSKKPDYKGIEIKAKRINSPTRNTIFSQVPDWKNSGEMSSRTKLLNKFGYCTRDKKGKARKSLYCTLKAHVPNPQGLYLDLDIKNDLLINKFKERDFLETDGEYVLQWSMETLRNRLLEKHHETYWIGAESKKIEQKEYFKYKIITHTKNPSVSAFPYLIDEQAITVDYAIHKYPNKTSRDHGFLFKIKPENRNLLFGNPIGVYDLDKRQ